MALSRKYLEGMGLEEKQVQAIVEAHADSIEALKAERDKYKEQAAEVPDLQKKLEEANGAKAEVGGWQDKYESEHKAFEDYKSQVAAEKADAQKAQAYRGMLVSADIDPKRIDAIMRLTDLSQVELDEEGLLKGADELKEAARKEWSEFVLKERTVGSDPATPPDHKNEPEGADPEIAQHMRERHERMFGKPE